MKTVGIGSLPHRSIDNAIIYSLKHDLPFLPQMTSLGELMVPQVLSNNEIEKKYCALESFTKNILEEKIINFKIQIAGPETCNVSSIIILNEVNKFIQYLDQYNLRPIIFIDEPVITFKNRELEIVFLELSKLNIETGLHSCALFDWQKVNNLNFKYLSFDIGLMHSISTTQKTLIPGMRPLENNNFKFNSEWISSSCGLANFTELECENILNELKSYK